MCSFKTKIDSVRIFNLLLIVIYSIVILQAQHPNIVTVREIVVGSNMDKIFIVMDYVEHDLKSLMETMKQKKQVFIPGGVFRSVNNNKTNVLYYYNE